MNERVRHAWSAALAALIALAVAAPALALTPTLEQAKAESGLRFSENAGLSHLREDFSVYAGGEAGPKANLAVQQPKLPRSGEVPPPPTGGNGGGAGSGWSIGRKILAGLGAVGGSVVAAGVAVATGGLSIAGFGLAGAVAAGYNSYNDGDRGWALAKKTVTGAAAGIAAIGLVGVLVGSGVGAAMERLFKRG